MRKEKVDRAKQQLLDILKADVSSDIKMDVIREYRDDGGASKILTYQFKRDMIAAMVNHRQKDEPLFAYELELVAERGDDPSHALNKLRKEVFEELNEKTLNSVNMLVLWATHGDTNLAWERCSRFHGDFDWQVDWLIKRIESFYYQEPSITKDLIKAGHFVGQMEDRAISLRMDTFNFLQNGDADSRGRIEDQVFGIRNLWELVQPIFKRFEEFGEGLEAVNEQETKE